MPEVLELARSQIGEWKYSLTDRNCEHFAKWATGLKMSSTQVAAGATGAILGASLVGLCSENPKFAKFLGGALALGGFSCFSYQSRREKIGITNNSSRFATLGTFGLNRL